MTSDKKFQEELNVKGFDGNKFFSIVDLFLKQQHSP
jgi:hypothetical protein